MAVSGTLIRRRLSDRWAALRWTGVTSYSVRGGMSAKGDWSDRPMIDAREGGATTTGSLELLLHRFRL